MTNGEYQLRRLDLSGDQRVTICLHDTDSPEVYADHTTPEWYVDAIVRAWLLGAIPTRTSEERDDGETG